MIVPSTRVCFFSATMVAVVRVGHVFVRQGMPDSGAQRRSMNVSPRPAQQVAPVWMRSMATAVIWTHAMRSTVKMEEVVLRAHVSVQQDSLVSCFFFRPYDSYLLECLGYIFIILYHTFQSYLFWVLFAQLSRKQVWSRHV